MSDHVLLDVGSQSITMSAETVGLQASRGFQVMAGTFSINGTVAARIATTDSNGLIMAGRALTMQANVVALTAETVVNLDSQTTNMTADALNINAGTVELQGVGQVTITSPTFSVLNDDDSSRVSIASNTPPTPLI